MRRLFTAACKIAEIKNKLRQIEQELIEKGFLTFQDTTIPGERQG